MPKELLGIRDKKTGKVLMKKPPALPFRPRNRKAGEKYVDLGTRIFGMSDKEDGQNFYV